MKRYIFFIVVFIVTASEQQLTEEERSETESEERGRAHDKIGVIPTKTEENKEEIEEGMTGEADMEMIRQQTVASIVSDKQWDEYNKYSFFMFEQFEGLKAKALKYILFFTILIAYYFLQKSYRKR